MKYWTIYLCFANMIAFLFYGIDKTKAKKNRWRIPEKILLGTAFIGGSVGAYAGMQVFRHKTQKAKFYLGVPIIFLIQVAVALYFIF